MNLVDAHAERGVVRGVAGAPLRRFVATEPHEPPDAEEAHDDRHPRVQPHPGDLVRRVDPHVLEPEAGEGVERST